MLKNIIKSNHIPRLLNKISIYTPSICSRHIQNVPAASIPFTNVRLKWSQTAGNDEQTPTKSNPFAVERKTTVGIGLEVKEEYAMDRKRNFAIELKEEQQPAANAIDPEKKRKILQLEMDVSRQEGRKVPDPSALTDEHWEHLLALKTKSARAKYYGFLWQVERKKENKEVKRAERLGRMEQRLAEERKSNEENPHLVYGLLHNTMFLRVYDATINYYNNYKLIRAMQFGQKLVFDCSYDEHMNKREAINTAKQLMLCFAENRFHDDPFDLHYCNANFNKVTMQTLERHIPTLREPDFPLNVHEKCFTEVFPKEKLVYLTPHCRNDLKEFNHDDIYIIGGIVDKVNNDPLSLAKAKRLGIRMARLPLDQYLNWGAGSGKSLTLNQMVNILLDLKKTGNWTEALKHVPRRKLYEAQTQKEERNVRLQSEKFKFDVNAWGSKKNKFSR